MFNVLIDTSVWLDLAQDKKQTPLLDPLVAMLKDGRVSALRDTMANLCQNEVCFEHSICC